MNISRRQFVLPQSRLLVIYINFLSAQQKSPPSPDSADAASTDRIQIPSSQLKDLCTSYVNSPVSRYGWPLWDTKDLRSAMCPPYRFYPKWPHQFPAQNKIALPHRLDRLILYLGREDLRSNPSDSACSLLSLWRTISLSILTSPCLSPFSFH